jgi:phenylalanyl-tRNA synthetase alpha chain
MDEKLKEIIELAKKEAERLKELKNFNQLKAKFLGKKGLITDQLKKISEYPKEQRAEIGQKLNQAKKILEDIFNKTFESLKLREKELKLQKEKIDITLNGRRLPKGSLHPITLILNEIEEIFKLLGFTVAEGPEIETDFYNFQALNIPKDHPARDMQDTFYIDKDLVLRTHTSPVQIRVMLSQKPPVKIIAPGKVYRCDMDMTHTPMFHQVEGLLVDKNISFAHLKGVLEYFLKSIFYKNIGIRFRPSFFPFTEPSAEVDIECIFCKGDGCRVCSGTGWLEILGCGMVHPEVYKYVNYDYEEYTGFAFGMGVERIAMLKYGINDLRLFFNNNLKFIQQF